METCSRCGAFAELVAIDAARYCPPCASRPEVTLPLRYREGRDAWAWVMTFAVAVSGAAAVLALLMEHFALAACWATLAATQALFGRGIAWLWNAMLLLSAGGAVLSLALDAPVSVAGFGWSLMLGIAAHQDTGSRLFHRQRVRPHEVAELIEQMQNNDVSRVAFSLAFASIFIPLLWPQALMMTVFAWKTIDPSATPPIGRGMLPTAVSMVASVPITAPVMVFTLLYLAKLVD